MGGASKSPSGSLSSPKYSASTIERPTQPANAIVTRPCGNGSVPRRAMISVGIPDSASG